MLTIEEIRAYLGNDHFAVNLGISIDAVSETGAVCSLMLEKRHMNSQNKAQGGVLFTLGDLTFAVAAIAHRKGTVTLNAAINYLRPAGGGRLVATAKRVRGGGRTSVYEVLITDDAGEAVALFVGTGFAMDRYADKSAGNSAEKYADNSAEKSADNSAEKCADKSTEKCANKGADKSAEKAP